MKIRENEDMILMFKGAIEIQRESIAQSERTIERYESAIEEIRAEITQEMAEQNILEAEIVQ